MQAGARYGQVRGCAWVLIPLLLSWSGELCNLGRMNDVLTTPDFALTAALWDRTAPALGFVLTDHDLHLIRARFSDPHQRVVILAQGHGDIPDLILKHSLAG
ncbi:MAG: hypothetical protein QNK98_01035 [Yoonia sp.]